MAGPELMKNGGCEFVWRATGPGSIPRSLTHSEPAGGGM